MQVLAEEEEYEKGNSESGPLWHQLPDSWRESLLHPPTIKWGNSLFLIEIVVKVFS